MQNFFAHHQISAQTIAVAVSGGADSLALVLMAKEELTVYDYKIVALTVNHGLRPNATKEATYVAELMKAHNIEHHILNWENPKPITGIEEAARKARYFLLTDWCKKNGIKVLLTAHHRNDQAETFLMRLIRGSGLDGLCCMREISHINDIIIARPLLRTAPEKMKQYLRTRGIKWVEDESNSNIAYLRNRIRSFLPQLEENIGLSAQVLAETVIRLQSAEAYIEQQLAQIMRAEIRQFADSVFYFKHADFLNWHHEIKFRIIAQLCRHDYIPRAESTLHALNAISQLPFTGLTLGGKEIFYADGYIWIVPELSAKHRPSREKWKKFVQKNPQYANSRIPHKARVAILMQTGETV